MSRAGLECGAQADRARAFYFLFAGLGPLNSAWPAVVWLVLRDARRHRRRIRSNIGNRLGHVVGWSVLTYTIWALLLFTPASTSLHQGSLALPLTLSITLLVGAWRIHSVLALTMVLGVVARFILIWLPPAAANPAYPSLPALILLGLGAAMLGASTTARPRSLRYDRS